MQWHSPRWTLWTSVDSTDTRISQPKEESRTYQLIVCMIKTKYTDIGLFIAIKVVSLIRLCLIYNRNI